MTVFVASIFLPYTIHFDVNQADDHSTETSTNNPQTPYEVHDGGYVDGQKELSLFADSNVRPQFCKSPADLVAGSEHNDFFIAGEKKSSSSSAKNLVPVVIRSIAPNEPHSPQWGRKSYFTQPKSRAESPPPSSILKHAWSKEKRGRASTLSVSEIREDSHERALKTADWSIEPAEQGNGGLRNAVNAACKADPSLEKTWVGTLGMPTDALESSRKVDIESRLEEEFDCLTVFPTDSDLDGHYSHYCKTILWPVFHYQIPDNPKSKAYEDHSWVYYVKINQAFADKIVKNYKRDDVVWVHDYHLLLVPSMVRKKLPDAKIGFFLHVAFPSSEVFRCLAVRNDLLEGLLGADLIGFQTQEYCNHFLQTCSRLLCVEATLKGVQLEDRFVNVATFPIGVDLGLLELRRKETEVSEWISRLQKRYAGKWLVVARDKLDHVRGVRQKLLSYEYFLNKYPKYRERVVLIQVATSTTEEAELNAAISDIVTRINSLHSSLAHQPLVFLKQDMEYQQYLAMLTIADGLMITSLREGMNLTSHEFIICQDGTGSDKKFGSLILSEFTGSASIFDGNELSVNPWDYRQCSEALLKAIEMSAKEKEERWSKLMDVVQHHSAVHWLKTFLSELDGAWDEHSRQHTISIPRLSMGALAEKYKAAESRLFFLDYEGTLATHESSKEIMFNKPQRTIDAVTELLSAEGNVVYVMSGKSPEELDMLFQRVPGLGLVAENGCFVKECGTEYWHEVADLGKMEAWKKGISKLIAYYQERVEGSSIEERHCSVIFRYKDAKDPQSAVRHAGECVNHINDSCRNLQVHAVPIEGGLVVESMELNKRTAAEQIFEGLKKKSAARGTGLPEFLMVAGDSRDDEVIYRWANELGTEGIVRHVTTVSLSSRNTEAMATLTQGITGVLSALRKLAALG